MRTIKIIVAAICLLMLLQSGAVAQTEVYISDQGGSHVGSCQDNTIGAGIAVTYNYGDYAYGFSGQNFLGANYWWLQRYNISSVPDNARITAAEIVVYVSGIGGSGGENVNIYEIADANNDWVEGTQAGAAQAGESCWNDHTYNNVQEWAGSAGLSTAGTDYINTSLASVAITSTGSKTFTLNATGIAAIEDRLADDTFEVLFKSNPSGASDCITFSSSEDADTAERPYLHITYVMGAVMEVIICE